MLLLFRNICWSEQPAASSPHLTSAQTMTTVAVSSGPPGAASAGLSRAGNSALTGIADPPSPSKPGSMEDAIKLWLKIGNIEKLQARNEEISLNLILMEANSLCSKLCWTVMAGI